MAHTTAYRPYVDDRSPFTEHDGITRASGQRRNATEQIEQCRAIVALVGRQSVLYAFRLTDGAIKIGCTSNLAARRRHYVGCTILAVAPGEAADEKALHDSLSDASRARGREYYHPTPEVLAVVNEMREHFGLDHLAA